jgi:hypothetical protein
MSIFYASFNFDGSPLVWRSRFDKPNAAWKRETRQLIIDELEKVPLEVRILESARKRSDPNPFKDDSSRAIFSIITGKGPAMGVMFCDLGLPESIMEARRRAGSAIYARNRARSKTNLGLGNVTLLSAGKVTEVPS